MAATRLWLAGILSLLAACGGDGTAPVLPPCTSSQAPLDLPVGELRSLNPGLTSGCTRLPANGSGASIEYLLVPQAASSKPNDSSAYQLVGSATAAAPPQRARAAVAGPPDAQQRFDFTLRRVERDLAMQLAAAQPRPRPAAPLATPPPALGDVRQFKVCGDTLCATHPIVTATAKAVRGRVAVFVDNQAPDTLTTADMDSLTAVFDTLLYATDTAAFGQETDVNGDNVVILLMTGKVNALVPKPCNPGSGVIVGFFYGGDLLAGFPDGNNAEMFYSIVPDPLGELSCSHSRSQVKARVPATFIHEFQHMISWGHHVVNGNGAPEQLWLNEGLSHYAEELGGRRFLPADTATFCTFVWGDLHNAGLYLTNPESHHLVDDQGIGGFANRGASWLFVRYLVDQLAPDPSIEAANAVTRSLVMTNLTGAANVANAAGADFATLVSRWSVANWVSDLGGGFVAPPELRYETWAFRSDFPRMRARCPSSVSGNIPALFPLTPGLGSGSAVDLAGVLRAGTGTYFRAQQDVGAAGFTLLFSDGTGRALRPALVPRLNVIRIQ